MNWGPVGLLRVLYYIKYSFLHTCYCIVRIYRLWKYKYYTWQREIKIFGSEECRDLCFCLVFSIFFLIIWYTYRYKRLIKLDKSFHVHHSKSIFQRVLSSSESSWVSLFKGKTLIIINFIHSQDPDLRNFFHPVRSRSYCNFQWSHILWDGPVQVRYQGFLLNMATGHNPLVWLKWTFKFYHENVGLTTEERSTIVFDLPSRMDLKFRIHSVFRTAFSYSTC